MGDEGGVIWASVCGSPLTHFQDLWPEVSSYIKKNLWDVVWLQLPLSVGLVSSRERQRDMQENMGTGMRSTPGRAVGLGSRRVARSGFCSHTDFQATL